MGGAQRALDLVLDVAGGQAVGQDVSRADRRDASGRAIQRVATPLAAPVRICPSWLASNSAAGSPLSAS
ncbi:MAG TPA: hypothetical protein VL132_22300 [Planctomycetaceae bacterium]|nr:hypothetical protein [Planctomycetaceae bacterium]